MKKIGLIGFFFIGFVNVWGQTNKIETTGNVGIGTTTPEATLHIKSNITSENSNDRIDANLVIEANGTTREISEGASLGFVIPANTNGTNPWQQGRIIVTPDNTANMNASGQMFLQTRYLNNKTWDWRNNLVLKSNGNVGIGTTAPEAKLDLLGSGEYLSILKLGNETWKCNQQTAIEFWNGIYKGVPTSKIISQMNNCGDGGENLIFQTQSPSSLNPNKTKPTTKLTIKSDGRIGIGTTNSGSWNAKLVINNTRDYTKILQLGAEGPTTWFIGIGDNSGNYFHIGENDNKRIVINKITGNVGIGIGSSSPSAKLQVAGDILADEIRVEDIAATNLNLEGSIAANQITVKANGNTADYVFSDTYNLKDLTEVESYIKTHKHLPDIPSAEEMEASGVNLAEMNKLLLEKIEELMLYAISQKKESKAMEERLEDQNAKLKEVEILKDKLANIEALLQITLNP